MLLEINQDLTKTKFIPPMTIDAFGENEKKLETCLTELIGDVLFPEADPGKNDDDLGAEECRDPGGHHRVV